MEYIGNISGKWVRYSINITYNLALSSVYIDYIWGIFIDNTNTSTVPCGFLIMIQKNASTVPCCKQKSTTT